MEWWQILLIIVVSLLLLFVLSIVFYKFFFKRFWDIVLSGLAIIVLSPILLVLSLLGLIFMKGNPFFTQKRPGKKGKNGQERIFKLIKFRTMSNKKDDSGNLLPDEQRLNKYGKFLRSTSFITVTHDVCIAIVYKCNVRLYKIGCFKHKWRV